MTTYKRITIITTLRDPLSGSTLTILRRALQPINKNGKPSKRPPLATPAYLIKYPDAGYRYYGKNGALAREKISAERFDAEANYADWREELYN